MKSHWRVYAAPVVARVLQETAGQPEPVIRRALTEAYPFGERAMWPYKCWLAEVAAQRGKRSRYQPQPEEKGQQNLFED